jgi:outer membrane protein assembly factor BamB
VHPWSRHVAVACAFVAALTLAAPSLSGDWPRYGGNDRVTNNVPAARSAGISSTSVRDLEERWSAQIGGRFVASPLYAENVRVGTDVENVVYAATNAGTIAALRAEDGQLLWQRQVSGTVQTCESTYGVSSTPVLDRGRNRLYVIGADGLLFALDLATGKTIAGWPVPVTGFPRSEYAWGGLAFYGTRIYVPIASYCDKPDENGYLADGRLVAVDVVDARVVASFDPVDGPNNMGGIWAYGGASIDQTTGHLWVTTGNSWVYDPECDCIVETVGYGEAIVELDSDLTVVSWNRPEGIPYVEDNDFGATPLLFQPPGCPPLVAANAKNGRTYVWNRQALADGPIWTARVGPDSLGSAFIGEPSYSAGLNMLFVSAARDYDEEGATRTLDAVVGFQLGPECTIPERPTWTAPGIGRGPKSPPLIVGDVVFVPGAFDRHVFALDARTGNTLWSTAMPGSVLAPISWARDEVLVGDSSGALHAFALPALPPPGTSKPGLYFF